MDFKLYNEPLQMLSNEELIRAVREAIQEEKKKKKERGAEKGSITINRFFKSKIFNKKW